VACSCRDNARHRFQHYLWRGTGSSPVPFMRLSLQTKRAKSPFQNSSAWRRQRRTRRQGSWAGSKTENLSHAKSARSRQLLLRRGRRFLRSLSLSERVRLNISSRRRRTSPSRLFRCLMGAGAWEKTTEKFQQAHFSTSATPKRSGNIHERKCNPLTSNFLYGTTFQASRSCLENRE
jgi:hypothetical protein